MITHKHIAWFNAAIISILLILMPFHAFVVTYLGYSLGHKEIFSAWKEVLVLILLVGSVWYWLQNKKSLPFDVVNILTIIIIGFSLLVSLVNADFGNSFLVGLKNNLLPLVLFLCAQIVAKQFSDRKMQQMLLIPAFVVVVLAFLQPYLFSPDFLLKLGYGPEGSSGTILAGQYIESATTTVRAFSTLGGPNQLGAFLLIPVFVSATYFAITRKWQYLVLSVFFAAGVFVSYSRSALIGLVCGIIVLIGLQLPNKIRKFVFAIAGSVIVVMLVLLLLPNRCFVSDVLPKSFVHGTCVDGQLSGSDNQRLQSQQAGLFAIAARPFGYGLGSAGPASFYSARPLITESWYLQIAVEAGVIGLLLYLALFIALGRDFYLKAVTDVKTKVWPMASFSILIGILVAAFFLHTWADSTLAIIGMTVFGIAKGKNV